MPATSAYPWTNRKPRAGWQADPTAVAELGLVSAWLANEGGGAVALDATGHQDTGTLSGGATWSQKGRLGPAFLASAGGLELIQVNSVANLPTAASAAWSIGFWHYTFAYKNISQVFGFGSQLPGGGGTGTYRYTLQFNSNYYFWGSSADNDSGVAWDTANGWHFIVWTATTGGTLTLYRDGVKVYSGSLSGSLTTAGTSITAFSGDGGNTPDMLLDECLIANRAWLPGEIATLYAKPFWLMRSPKRRAVYGKISGGTNYTLSGIAGSFTLTGKSLTESTERPFSALAGSFALTGKTATLSSGRPMSASAGVFAITGEAALTSWARHLAGSAGSFVVTGEPVTFVKGKGLAGAAGSFVVTGAVAALNASRGLSISTGTFTISGKTAGLSAGRSMTTSTGSFSLAGKTMAQNISRLLSAGAGTFVVTGQIAALTVGGQAIVSAVFSFAVQFTYVQSVSADFASVQSQSPQFVYVQTQDVEFAEE